MKKFLSVRFVWNLKLRHVSCFNSYKYTTWHLAMIKINHLLLTAFMLAGSTLAQAGVISTGSAVTLNPDNTVTFERNGIFPNGEILTNQFASQGVTFVGGSDQAPVLFNNGFCNPGGLTGSSFVAIGVSTGCGVANDNSIASLVFSSDVQALSFTYVTNNSSNYLFEALLNGETVSTKAVSSSLNPFRTTFLFTGSTFDTVRFTETGAGGNWFWIDNLSWRSAPTNNVPEPTSIALLGFGLVGMAAMRRKSKQA